MITISNIFRQGLTFKQKFQNLYRRNKHSESFATIYFTTKNGNMTELLANYGTVVSLGKNKHYLKIEHPYLNRVDEVIQHMKQMEHPSYE